MGFPSYLELIKHYNLFLLSGPILLLASLVCWSKLIRSKRGPIVEADRKKRRDLLFLAIGTLVIGGVHFFGIYASVVNAWRFRRLEPSQVVGLRIQRMKEEGFIDSSPPVIVEDAALIQQGLRALTNAQSRSRNHESFSDGYRIQLLIGDPRSSSDYYLSVYRKNSLNADVNVVIPHIGVKNGGTVNHGGEYSSPEFAAWVSRHIDPLFTKP